MKRWEYFTTSIENGGLLGGKIDLPQINGALNHYGAQGWELVSATTTIHANVNVVVTLFLKREVFA